MIAKQYKILIFYIITYDVIKQYNKSKRAVFTNMSMISNVRLILCFDG